MTMEYDVRVYCEDCEEKKRSTETTDNDTWIPSGCETHTIRDFVVEKGQDV